MDLAYHIVTGWLIGLVVLVVFSQSLRCVGDMISPIILVMAILSLFINIVKSYETKRYSEIF